MLAGYVLYRDGRPFAGGREILLAHDLAKDTSADGGGPVTIEGPGILRGREVIAVYQDGRLLLQGETDTEEPVRDVISLVEAERVAILNALEHTNGDRGRAARLLGISRTTLFRKLRQYGAEQGSVAKLAACGGAK